MHNEFCDKAYNRFETIDFMASTKKMTVNWTKNYRLVAKNENGVTVNFDAAKDFGGEDWALTPMENVLASLAACSTYDVLIILKKKRQKISGLSVEATAERREDHPRIFTKIHLNYKVKGEKVSLEAVERSIKLSMDTYCSVGGMIKNSVPITHSFEVTST